MQRTVCERNPLLLLLRFYLDGYLLLLEHYFSGMLLCRGVTSTQSQTDSLIAARIFVSELWAHWNSTVYYWVENAIWLYPLRLGKLSRVDTFVGVNARWAKKEWSRALASMHVLDSQTRRFFSAFLASFRLETAVLEKGRRRRQIPCLKRVTFPSPNTFLLGSH